jgi:hypothetical protein
VQVRSANAERLAYQLVMTHLLSLDYPVIPFPRRYAHASRVDTRRGGVPFTSAQWPWWPYTSGPGASRVPSWTPPCLRALRTVTAERRTSRDDPVDRRCIQINYPNIGRSAGTRGGRMPCCARLYTLCGLPSQLTLKVFSRVRPPRLPIATVADLVRAQVQYSAGPAECCTNQIPQGRSPGT